MKILMMLLMATISFAQPKILVTETLGYVGSPVGLDVGGVSKIAFVDYRVDTLLIRVNKSLTTWTPKAGGSYKIHAMITDSSGGVSLTDIMSVYVCTPEEISRIAFMNVNYQWKKTVFPDSAVVLPQGAIVIAKTHSLTTKKTTLEFLNPLFK